MEQIVPGPLKEKKYFTPGVIVIMLIALNGLAFLALRFIFGLGYVTNLSNQYPWGIWIGVDVAAGVALAAGGFTSAALGHVMHREDYHVIIRPALLTAMLGYTFVALAVCIDIGRWYYIWHPMIMWNGTSALFEVGICVMIYMTVLYIEFIPVVTERFMGHMNLPVLKFLNKPIDKLLMLLDRTLDKSMFVFIIAGVVLSTLHQSSLGTLMVIAGPKMHPLWQTSILPLLFLLSAVAVGFPMIIFESLLSSWAFKTKPESGILTRLGSLMPPILALYLSFKLGDMFIRQTFTLLRADIETFMFATEIILMAVPLVMFMSRRVIKSMGLLFTASAFVIIAVLINRINNFIIAYHPPYSHRPYYPSFGEISVTIGFIAIFILVYRFIVLNFPVISVKTEAEANNGEEK